MPTPDRTIKTLYKILYSGAELDAALQALEKYPTFATDCAQDKAKKEFQRKEYMKRLLNQPV